MPDRSSPYYGHDPVQWSGITRELIERHPLQPDQLVESVRDSWADIFHTRVGEYELRIGRDIFPQPQIMGFLLHELIPVRISQQYNGWRRDIGGTEKDAVYEPHPFFSFEIKTSSHPARIFGNRSYAQQGASSKRIKDGYLLAINFQGFKLSATPILTRIRFGWIDHDDWVGQASPTGQQASLSKDADRYKLVDIVQV